MAGFRRRGFRGFRRRSMRGPSRFAGSRRGASSLEWVSLGGLTVPRDIRTHFGAPDETVGGQDYYSVALLPLDIVRGPVVTLRRIVGHLAFYDEHDATKEIGTATTFGTTVTGVNSFAGYIVPQANIQLVQASHGSAGVPLQHNNAADMDSPNFLWRREYPAEWLINGGSLQHNPRAPNEGSPYVDVRVMRRFDRSQWDLRLQVSLDSGRAGADKTFISYLFRGLFSSTSGL